jgi:rubrerythrin
LIALPKLIKYEMKNFIKKKEDFMCGNCGYRVVGDGYTDHCPKCLWGKHVDEEIPGDRASECKGLMEPIRAVYQKDKFRIVYKCQKCRHEFEVREGKGDSRDKLVEMCGII